MGPIIGLSGKSCSGKNYVGKHIAGKGFEVWDLDRKAEEIREEKRDEIIKAFGTEDRREIGKIVFSNPEKRKALENIIYPELEKRIKDHDGILVINGATIHRAGMDKLCSFLIYTDAPYEVRLFRAMMRDGVSAEEFKLRDQAQADVDPKDNAYRCPVYIFDTSGNPDYSKLDEITAEGLCRFCTSRPES